MCVCAFRGGGWGWGSTSQGFSSRLCDAFRRILVRALQRGLLRGHPRTEVDSFADKQDLALRGGHSGPL